jgi:hypothetical protein
MKQIHKHHSSYWRQRLESPYRRVERAVGTCRDAIEVLAVRAGERLVDALKGLGS